MKLRNQISWILVTILAVILCSCGGDTPDEELMATNRLNLIFDGTEASLRLNTNVQSGYDLSYNIGQLAAKDPFLKERLTTRPGLKTSRAIMSTNMQAWLHPESFKDQIAVILPEPIKSNGREVYMGINFGGAIVQFAAPKR